MKDTPSPAGAAPRTSVHSRFIPREELSHFEAWAPGALAPDGPAAHGPGNGATTGVLGAGAKGTPARDARQAGYQDGYRDGLAAMEAFKQSFASQTSAQLGALLASVGLQLDALQQAMAIALADTAAQLARQVVRSELGTRPELVAAVAEQALDALMLSARHITLRVHPDDQPLVAQGAADVLAARGARLIADASVQRGGCLVESDLGTVDATIEARWRHAVAAIGSERPWNNAAAGNGTTSADPQSEATGTTPAAADAPPPENAQ